MKQLNLITLTMIRFFLAFTSLHPTEYPTQPLPTFGEILTLHPDFPINTLTAVQNNKEANERESTVTRSIYDENSTITKGG
jgi:hypothetical protein